MNKAKQRSPHELIMLRTKLAWRRKRLAYLVGNSKFNHKSKLLAVSISGVGLEVIARAISDFAIVSPAWTIALMLMGSFAGGLVLTTIAHRWLKRHFAKFKSAKLLGLGLLALVTFVAHGQAVGEVNAIFQLDASALPHTTAAASAMVIGRWVFWTLLLPVIIASLTSWLVFYAKSRYGEAMMSFAVLMASITWGALIFQQVGPEMRRKSNLYQVALEMDFNKRSHCVALPDGAEGVLFIGPDQKRALVAPRKVVIPTRGDFGTLVPQIQVPSNFQIVACE